MMVGPAGIMRFHTPRRLCTYFFQLLGGALVQVQRSIAEQSAMAAWLGLVGRVGGVVVVLVGGGSWSQVTRARFGDLKNGGEEEINSSDLRANRAITHANSLGRPFDC